MQVASFPQANPGNAHASDTPTGINALPDNTPPGICQSMNMA